MMNLKNLIYKMLMLRNKIIYWRDAGDTRITPSPRINKNGTFLFDVLYTSSYVSSSISIDVIVSSASDSTMLRC